MIAFPAELDKWARRQDAMAHDSARSTLKRNSSLSAELAHRTHELHNRTQELIRQTISVMERARRRGDNADGEFALPKAE